MKLPVMCLLALHLANYLSAALPEDQSVVINSTYAEYNGKHIFLSGDVKVDYDLGTISANAVELIPETVEKTSQFNKVILTDDVKIALKDGGLLTCAKGNINYLTKEGYFYGDPEHEYVVYTEQCKDKSGIAVPLIVKSHQMTIRLEAEEVKSSEASHNCINAITTDGNVTVNYNNDFIAAADHGNYQRKVEAQKGVQETLPGLIFLRSMSDPGVCQVTNRNGDLIKASHICIDTIKRHILFAYPQGALFYPSPASKENAETERIDFSSDTLTWDDQEHVLTLCDHVIVNQQGLGTITTEEKLQIFQHTVQGKQCLKSIESNGTTHLKYIDKEKELAHTLTCYGKAVVLHDQLKTILESPCDDKGNVIKGKQVYFQDDMGEIYADKLTILYTMIEGEATPSKLILEGHVRILNQGAIDPEKTKAFLEYALADRVEYSPQAKEITLSASPKRRVLFFDRINNLQVSASSLKIRRDEATKKELVQGQGNVRFSFVKHELEEMKKQFHLEEFLGPESGKEK